MDDQDIRAHCEEIDRCNQRGGRMLCVVDLIEAGTMDRELAAYSLAAVGGGASFMVGALPGGAGKTTVMGALLNFVPPGVRLVPADGLETIEAGLAARQERRCYVCHEIGSGSYYAYLWGRALRRYFELPAAGHMIATNLHADTCEQARAQVCDENGVPADHFRRVNLLYFLHVDGWRWAGRRRIVELWASDGEREHRPVFQQGEWLSSHRTCSIVHEGRLEEARGTIDKLIESGARSIQEVRSLLVEDRASKSCMATREHEE